ncbi:MAG: SDR family NAD(P)-dependent oxidoreductase, partial [Candidatus Rokuibacteriota bacterium]
MDDGDADPAEIVGHDPDPFLHGHHPLPRTRRGGRRGRSRGPRSVRRALDRRAHELSLGHLSVARVAICARTESTLKETAAEIARSTGTEIVPIAVDLSSLAGCQGLVEHVAKRLGGIDILVKNAGASAFWAFVDLPDDAFVDAINGKLLGCIQCAKTVILHMHAADIRPGLRTAP